MSGAPTPVLMVEAFAASGAKTNPIPTPTQVGIDPARASLDTGFPPATMTPLTSGGKPPFGTDMNGILYMLSSHIVALQAGQPYTYNATLSTALGGYKLGAILASASVAGRYFYNVLAGNTNDPDSVVTGWVQFSPPATGATGLQTTAPAAGTFNDVALSTGVGFLDVTPTGAAIYTGFAGGIDGQILVVSNLAAAQTLTLRSLVLSAAGNQLRLAADLTLLTRQTQAFRYTTAPATAVWVPL